MGSSQSKGAGGYSTRRNVALDQNAKQGGLAQRNKSRESSQRTWLIFFALLQMVLGGLAIGYAVYSGQKKAAVAAGVIAGVCTILPSLLGVIGACARRPGLLLYYFMTVVLGLCVFISVCLILLTIVSIGCDLNQNASRNCASLSCSSTNSCSSSDLKGTSCKALPTDVCDNTSKIMAWSLCMVAVVALVQIFAGYLTMSMRSILLKSSSLGEAAMR